jgi:hypothetical protein
MSDEKDMTLLQQVKKGVATTVVSAVLVSLLGLVGSGVFQAHVLPGRVDRIEQRMGNIETKLDKALALPARNGPMPEDVHVRARRGTVAPHRRLHE